MKNKSKKRGFTIVELVIVIAVIAVLAAVLIPTFADVINNANDSKATQEAKNAYTQFMIDNAQEGDLAQLYIFKADKKRFVAIRDGVPQGIFSSRDEALRSLTDDPEYYLYKTTVKNLFGVNKGSIIVDNDGSDDTQSTFEEIKLKYGDHYFGGDANDRTAVSSEVKVYLRGGEGLKLIDLNNYDLEIIASQPLSVNSTPVSIYSVAPVDGWYGIVIRKSDDSAFDFENGDSDLLCDYARVFHPMITNMSGIMPPSVISMYKLYLHEGDVIKLEDKYKDLYECHMKEGENPYYDISITAEGTTVTTEGWYTFRLKSTQNYIIYNKDGINLYNYVTIESPDNG